MPAVWLVADVYVMVATVVRGVDPSGGVGRQWLPSALAALAMMDIQIYNNAVDGVGFGVRIAWISALLTFVVGSCS